MKVYWSLNMEIKLEVTMDGRVQDRESGDQEGKGSLEEENELER